MKRLFLLLLCAITLLPLSAKSKKKAVRLRDDNISEVIQSMSLREKSRIVVGGGWKSLFAGYHFPFCCNARVPGAAGTTHAIKRLGIPSIILSDGPAGVRIRPDFRGSKKTRYATAFPNANLLASSWDTTLVREIGAAMGAEARDYGVDVLLAPGMNLMRNPLCGRNYEYYSEDPLLTGEMASAMIRGIQSHGVGACAKHYVANNQETRRKSSNSLVADSVLRQIYLRGFEIAIRESHPWTLMASYNKVNGTHAMQNRYLLTDILRNEWGFRGAVMTDWGFFGPSAQRIDAGCDLMEAGDRAQKRKIRRAVRRGKLSMERLDTAVSRVLQLVVKTNTFRGVETSNHPDLEAHAHLTRTVAAEGIVLLENRNNTLPLIPTKIALYGANGYRLIAGGVGSGYVNAPYSISLENSFEKSGFSFQPNLKETYESYANKKKNILKAGGFGFVQKYMGKGALREMPLSKEAIEQYETETSVAVICIGRQGGEGKDRKISDDFCLTQTERQLIEDVCATYHRNNKRVVVVLNVNGVIETASWKHLPDAILLAWCPGEEGGNSIVDVMTGKVNPSGCLTMTWPKRYEDTPSAMNFPSEICKNSDSETRYAEGIEVGYRGMGRDTIQVSYPFGYGLSYSQFLEFFKVVNEEDSGSKTIEFTVRNLGPFAGKHVVQYYSNGLFSGFGKTRLLQPGEEEVLRITTVSN